jgi:glycosyltransferase involved in cell wall biosynthesis
VSGRKPRTLFVSRERFRLPLGDAQRRKWDAVGEALDYRVVAAAATRSPVVAERFELAAPRPLLDGPLYYLALPFRVARALRTFRPDAVVVQNAHETALALVARAAVRSRTPVILDLHGDWRAATRLYGSPLRRLLQPIGDIAAQFAVRRADAVRTISAWTSGLVRELGVEPAAVFPAFVDAASFRASTPRPLPAEPRALYVGVLERYKGFDVLADAWPEVARALPDARLHVVGRGSLGASAAALVSGGGVEWDEALAPGEVAAALDEATVLVLPSRAEGLGRVVIEAFCRARPVVGGRAGGIPDIVEDGRNGLLVEPGDAAALAEAVLRILRDRALAERLGAAGAEDAPALAVEPQAYAAALADLVLGVVEG